MSLMTKWIPAGSSMISEIPEAIRSKRDQKTYIELDCRVNLYIKKLMSILIKRYIFKEGFLHALVLITTHKGLFQASEEYIASYLNTVWPLSPISIHWRMSSSIFCEMISDRWKTLLLRLCIGYQH